MEAALTPDAEFWDTNPKTQDLKLQGYFIAKLWEEAPRNTRAEQNRATSLDAKRDIVSVLYSRMLEAQSEDQPAKSEFRKLGVPYFGVLIIRILLFKVLY